MTAITVDNSPKRGTLNLRIKAEDRGLISRAAELLGKTITDFVLEAARREAEEALLDQTQFKVSPEVLEAFHARLDAPPQPNEQLRKTMSIVPPWK
jgi:uncharacterized protein (DUF1778 family)